MANGTTPSNTTQSASTLKVSTLKDAGVKSLWIGLATGLGLFAVQAAVVAGKAVVADIKELGNSLKS